MRVGGLRGLAALPRRVRTTDSRHSYPIAPNRIGRSFTASAPSQVWLADLTYVPTGVGWLYLAALIDMHTRKIVGWAMRETLHAGIAVEASVWPSSASARPRGSSNTRIAACNTRQMHIARSLPPLGSPPR
jgi:transposase InsO family protein